MKDFKHFTWHQRLELYRYLYVYNLSKWEIAKRLNKHISNIYREINRGMCESIDSHYNPVYMYSPEIAQKNYETNREKCGRNLKLKKGCYSLCVYERIIIDKDYSPRACIIYLLNHRQKYKLVDIVSYSTLYRYIYKKLFYRLTMKNLAYYKNRIKYMHIKRQKRASAGRSIEYRDEAILYRYEFGHWEMDSLEGSTYSKKAVLNLTERKTRKSILFLINSKNPKDVAKCLNCLEAKYSSNFSKVFKTITVDNGVEFSNPKGFERSIFCNRKRTKIYYCHSHSPHERGSNENLNRMLRRKIRKGSNIDKLTHNELNGISEWINNYPRKILNWDSAEERFQKELKKLNKNY